MFRIALGLLIVPAIAVAADPPVKPTSVTASLGYVSSTGNSEVQTLTASDKLSHKAGEWLLVQDADALYGTNAGVENAGRYRFGLRADYSMSERIAIYGLAAWRRDVFGGVARQFDEGVGLTFHALVPSPQLLDFEVGAGLTQRRDTFDQEASFTTGRLGLVYRYYFAEKTYFDALGVYLHNFETAEDYEWDGKLALVAPLSNILAVKLGYTSHYRNLPPPGIKQSDRTFSAGIQATW
jgi:putative salt-induced outer membrane protein YdiY